MSLDFLTDSLYSTSNFFHNNLNKTFFSINLIFMCTIYNPKTKKCDTIFKFMPECPSLSEKGKKSCQYPISSQTGITLSSHSGLLI